MRHDNIENRQSAVCISLMLAVEDAGKAAEWYERALGAIELWSLGSVVGLHIDGAPFFLQEPTNTGFVSPSTSASTTVRVEVFVDDPDALIRLSRPGLMGLSIRFGIMRRHGERTDRDASAILSLMSGWSATSRRWNHSPGWRLDLELRQTVA
jgi:hypothetical protein